MNSMLTIEVFYDDEAEREIRLAGLGSVFERSKTQTLEQTLALPEIPANTSLFHFMVTNHHQACLVVQRFHHSDPVGSAVTVFIRVDNVLTTPLQERAKSILQRLRDTTIQQMGRVVKELVSTVEVAA